MRDSANSVLPFLTRRLGLAAVAVLSLTVAASAQAAPLQPDTQAYVANGPVSALTRAADGSTFIGGDFTRVGPRVGHGIAVTSDDATPDPGFQDVSGGDVLATVSDGAGGWYIGGTFTGIQGVDQASVAHLLASGAVDTNFAPALFKSGGSVGEVRALALDNGSLYIGGDFQRVNSPTDNRTTLAELDAADGGLLATVAPAINGPVDALAILPGGLDPITHPERLVLGGHFTLVDGLATGNMGAINLDGPAAGDRVGWNPDLVVDGDPASATVHGILTRGDPSIGQTIYAVGEFDASGAVSGFRFNAAAWAVAGGSMSATPNIWHPSLDGVGYSIATDDTSIGIGNSVYVGGAFRHAGGFALAGITRTHPITGANDAGWNPDPAWSGGTAVVRSIAVARGTTTADNQIIIGGTFDDVDNASRYGVAAVDDDGAVIDGWDPNVSAPVRSVAVDDDAQVPTHSLYLGGEFTAAGPETVTRLGLAKLDAAGVVDPAWAEDVDGHVGALALADDDLFVGGTFVEVDGTPRTNAAKLSASGAGTLDATWDPSPNGAVDALAVSGTDVLLGGSFSTVGGVARPGAAKLSRDSGTTDPSWDPEVSGGTVAALTVDGDDVYLGGDFFRAKGGSVLRDGLVRTSVTGDGTPDDFDLKLGNGGRALSIDVFGMNVYVGGAFNAAGGTRANLVRARTDGTGAADPDWDPSPDGRVTAVSVLGDDVYIGGAFTQVGAVGRPGLARVSASGAGAVDASWDPLPEWVGGQVVAPIATEYDAVRLGGTFGTMTGFSTSGYAQLATGRAPTPVATIDLGVPHDFGSVPVGTKSPDFDYTLVNTGNADLTIDSIATTGAGFETDAGDCPVALAPGDTCQVSVRFAPTAPGAVSGSLDVDTHGGDPSVGLSGTGTGGGNGPVDPPVVDPPAGTPSAGDAPKTDPPPHRPAATPRPPKISIPIRCARPSRAGVVGVPIVVRSQRPLAVSVSVDYAEGTKGVDRCPKRGADRRFKGDVRNVDKLNRVKVRAAAVMVDRKRTLALRLEPGLYRVTVRAHLTPRRLSEPTRRWIRVLNPAG